VDVNERLASETLLAQGLRYRYALRLTDLGFLSFSTGAVKNNWVQIFYFFSSFSFKPDCSAMTCLLLLFLFFFFWAAQVI